MLFAQAATDPSFPWVQAISAVSANLVIVILAYFKLRSELAANTKKTETAATAATAAVGEAKAATVEAKAAAVVGAQTAETVADVHRLVNGERSAMQEKIEALTAENARLKAGPDFSRSSP